MTKDNTVFWRQNIRWFDAQNRMKSKTIHCLFDWNEIYHNEEKRKKHAERRNVERTEITLEFILSISTHRNWIYKFIGSIGIVDAIREFRSVIPMLRLILSNAEKIFVDFFSCLLCDRNCFEWKGKCRRFYGRQWPMTVVCVCYFFSFRNELRMSLLRFLRADLSIVFIYGAHSFRCPESYER